MYNTTTFFLLLLILLIIITYIPHNVSQNQENFNETINNDINLTLEVNSNQKPPKVLVPIYAPWRMYYPYEMVYPGLMYPPYYGYSPYLNQYNIYQPYLFN